MKTNKTAKKELLPAVTSIGDLSRKAATDERYAKLAIAGASNLGMPCRDLRTAIQSLVDSASVEGCDEDGVVAEVNFVRSSI